MNLQKVWAAFDHLSEMKSTVFSGHSLTPHSEHHCFKNEQLKPLCPCLQQCPLDEAPSCWVLGFAGHSRGQEEGQDSAVAVPGGVSCPWIGTVRAANTRPQT